MFPRIQKLSPNVVNQIAAGEVIERPASVVKELIENSIDAKASHISIDIQEGGYELIRVEDDGVGIHPDDLPLAIAQYATSKISATSDLLRLPTLGFRGEALASIASVSLFTLQSRQQSSPHGWQIQTRENSSQTTPITPIAHPIGTTVEVRDLFFNTPVRRKFLRSPKTEWLHIEKLVKRLALCYFQTSFKLSHQHKKVWDVPSACSLLERNERMGRVYGRFFLKNAQYIEREAVGLKLCGWLAQEFPSMDESLHQSIFINHRWVKDKIVMHAIKQALLEVCHHPQPPAYLLYLELEPTEIDVNVHPTKTEVRFKEPRYIHDFVWSSVKQMITGRTKTVVYEENALVPPAIRSEANVYTISAPIETSPAEPSFPLGKAMALLHDRLILAENSEGLVIVHLQKAHTWLAQKILQKEFPEKIKSTPLLMPLPLTLSTAIHWKGTEETLLASFGFDIGCLGPKSFMVRQIPTALKYGNIVQLTQTLLMAISEKPSFDWNDFLLLVDNHYTVSTNLLPKEIEAMNSILRHLESQIESWNSCSWFRQLTFSDLQL